jgi:hypothetical protein
MGHPGAVLKFPLSSFVPHPKCPAACLTVRCCAELLMLQNAVPIIIQSSSAIELLPVGTCFICLQLLMKSFQVDSPQLVPGEGDRPGFVLPGASKGIPSRCCRRDVGTGPLVEFAAGGILS